MIMAPDLNLPQQWSRLISLFPKGEHIHYFWVQVLKRYALSNTDGMACRQMLIQTTIGRLKLAFDIGYDSSNLTSTFLRLYPHGVLWCCSSGTRVSQRSLSYRHASQKTLEFPQIGVSFIRRLYKTAPGLSIYSLQPEATTKTDPLQNLHTKEQ